MQSMNWTREHCDALREDHARGMSFAEIAEAINTKFKTDYSRNVRSVEPGGLGLPIPPGRSRHRQPAHRSFSGFANIMPHRCCN